MGHVTIKIVARGLSATAFQQIDILSKAVEKRRDDGRKYVFLFLHDDVLH